MSILSGFEKVHQAVSHAMEVRKARRERDQELRERVKKLSQERSLRNRAKMDAFKYVLADPKFIEVRTYMEEFEAKARSIREELLSPTMADTPQRTRSIDTLTGYIEACKDLREHPQRFIEKLEFFEKLAKRRLEESRL